MMNNSAKDTQILTYEQVSAGGVVFRRTGSDIEVVIVHMVPEMRWQLPKGIIDEGETTEEAAVREVREESGLEAKLIAPIETIEYWFTADYDGERRRYHKFVHFYLMSYTSGDVIDHDDEVDEARWVSVDEAVKTLDFKSERDVVTKAAEMIAASTEVK